MSIERLQGVPGKVPGVTSPAHPEAAKARPAAAEPFGSVLRQQQGEMAGGVAAPVKFSAHAQQRLASRGIRLDDSDVKRIGEAVDRAQKKGARESLLVLRDLALIVSVPHRTVITAVDGSSMRENVFTNIDSAVIL